MTYLPRNRGFWTILTFVGLGLLALLYIDGRITYGMKSYHVVYGAKSGNGRTGLTLGPSTVYLRQGQELVVSYDVEIKQGNATISVDPGFYGVNSGSVARHTITDTGKGAFAAFIARDGWYRLTVSCGTMQGCDVDYTVSWKARRVPNN